MNEYVAYIIIYIYIYIYIHNLTPFLFCIYVNIYTHFYIKQTKHVLVDT